MGFWDKWFAGSKTDNSLDSNVANGNVDAVQKLIAAGANVSMKDTGGMTALHLAVMTGNRSTIQALLDVGGKVDFNNVAAPGAPVENPAPVAPSSVALSSDIEVRKPLTFKSKR